MKKMSTKEMVTAAVLSAIIVVLGYTPLGLIPLPTMTATILHIPVAIGAILYGPAMGLTLGMVMGLTSLSKAFIAPTSPLDYLFQNPLISVLPRALMGVLTAYVFITLRKVIKKSSISVGITAAIASIANTVLTLGALVIIYSDKVAVILAELAALGVAVPGTAMAFVVGIASTSGIAEAIITVIVVVPIIIALRKTLES
ncbi:MAG TPA: ECF transporter S component [Epulopiscium sp.]|nr:ECF transporter S component [Candidatus Epulonipiscium sp.]